MREAVERHLKDCARSALQALGVGKWGRPVDHYFGRPILTGQQGNDAIAALMQADGPFLAARIGGTELTCLNDYLEGMRRGRLRFSAEVRKKMETYSGFFPATDPMLERFSREFLEHLSRVDVLGVWFNANEDGVCRDFAPQAQLVRLRGLEPYYHSAPWSRHLEGKKVLVVHPFQRTILSQVELNRERIFADPGVLPAFTLDTVKAVQSIAGNETGFQDWFQAYRHMCDQIAAKDFDVAIIGAGAYGLHLASFVKGLGKKAVHMAGATQILFGIKGKRWDQNEDVARLYNPYWVRPGQDEIPAQHRKVEQGCYW